MKNLLFITVITLFSSCFSYYKQYEKVPCKDLSTQSVDIKKIAADRNIIVSDTALFFGKSKKPLYFNKVNKVIVQTKLKFKGKRYMLVIHTGKGNFSLWTYDKDLAIRVYSELECNRSTLK